MSNLFIYLLNVYLDLFKSRDALTTMQLNSFFVSRKINDKVVFFLKLFIILLI